MAKKIRWTYEWTEEYCRKNAPHSPQKPGYIETDIRDNKGLLHTPWTTDDFDTILSGPIKDGMYVWYEELDEELS